MDSCRFDILGNVPVELFFKIVEYLKFKDILSCQIVSKAWFFRLNSNSIWKKLLQGDCPNKEVHLRRDFRWMVMMPCEFKLRVLNHKRIVKNWRENKYNRFELKNYDSLYCTATAYDGKTLVVSSSRHPKSNYFSVYLVERGKLWLQQLLKIDNNEIIGLATNTKYIVVNSGVHLLVYHFGSTRKKSYKLAYVLCRGLKNGSMNRIANTQFQNIHECINNPLESISFFLINETLFASSSEYVCAWDLEKEEQLLELPFNSTRCFLTDGLQAYVSSPRCIEVFDSKAEKQFTINPKKFISRIMVNINLIVAVLNDEIAGYNKFDGIPRFHLYAGISDHCLIHPLKDILYDIYSDVQLCAYAPLIGCQRWRELWRLRMSDTVGLGNLQFVAGDTCLFITSFSGYDCEVVDSDTGEPLYKCEADCYLKGNYDNLIYFSRRKGCVVVHVYS